MPTYRDSLHAGRKVPLVETDDILKGAITTDKISDGAVTTPKLADGAVTTPKLADGAVTKHHLAAGAVTADKLSDGLLDNLDLAIRNLLAYYEGSPTTPTVIPYASDEETRDAIIDGMNT
ncbi:MAG: hypothetical protein IJ551_01785 [Prevotella sp.]|nr:hypothetical protein [Prevotella sp.]